MQSPEAFSVELKKGPHLLLDAKSSVQGSEMYSQFRLRNEEREKEMRQALEAMQKDQEEENKKSADDGLARGSVRSSLSQPPAQYNVWYNTAHGQRSQQISLRASLKTPGQKPRTRRSTGTLVRGNAAAAASPGVCSSQGQMSGDSFFPKPTRRSSPSHPDQSPLFPAPSNMKRATTAPSSTRRSLIIRPSTGEPLGSQSLVNIKSQYPVSRLRDKKLLDAPATMPPHHLCPLTAPEAPDLAFDNSANFTNQTASPRTVDRPASPSLRSQSSFRPDDPVRAPDLSAPRPPSPDADGVLASLTAGASRRSTHVMITGRSRENSTASFSAMDLISTQKSRWKHAHPAEVEDALQSIIGPENVDAAKRLPLSRAKIAELNHILDDMLEEVRLAPMMTPMAVPSADQLKFGSVTSLDEDLSGRGYDVIFSQLVGQSSKKLQRVRKFYKHVNDGEMQSLRTALAAEEQRATYLQEQTNHFQRLRKLNSMTFKNNLNKLAGVIGQDGPDDDASTDDASTGILVDRLMEQLDNLAKEGEAQKKELDSLKLLTTDLRDNKMMLELKNADLQDRITELEAMLQAREQKTRRRSVARYSRRSRNSSMDLEHLELNEEGKLTSSRQTSDFSDGSLKITSPEGRKSNLDDNLSIVIKPLSPQNEEESEAFSAEKSPVVEKKETFPMEEIVEEERQLAKELGDDLQNMENVILDWANGVLSRAGYDESSFITDLGTDLSDGVYYTQIQRRLHVENMQRQHLLNFDDNRLEEELKSCDEILAIDNDLERCIASLENINGVTQPLAESIAHLENSPEAHLFHCMMLGLLLLYSTPLLEGETDSAWLDKVKEQVSESKQKKKKSSNPMVDAGGGPVKKRFSKKRNRKKSHTPTLRRKSTMRSIADYSRKNIQGGAYAESRANVLESIASIYEAKAAIGQGNDKKQKDLGVFTNEFIANKYGLQSLADKAITSFAFGVLNNQDSARIRLFAKLSGINDMQNRKGSKNKSKAATKKQEKSNKGNSHSSSSSDSDSSSSSEEDEAAFDWKSPTASNFFLKLLVEILPREKVAAKLGSNEKVLVLRAQVDRAISKNFSHATDMFNTIRTLKIKLDEMNETEVGLLPGSLQGETAIPLDEALEEIMKYAPNEIAGIKEQNGSSTAFSKREISNMLRGIAKRRSIAKQGDDTDEQNELRKLFLEYDTDEDNCLSKAEFRQLLLHIDDTMDDDASQTIIEDALKRYGFTDKEQDGEKEKISLDEFLTLTKVEDQNAPITRKLSLRAAPQAKEEPAKEELAKEEPGLQPEIKVALSSGRDQPKLSLNDSDDQKNVDTSRATLDELVASGEEQTKKSEEDQAKSKPRRRKSRQRRPSVTFHRRRSSIKTAVDVVTLVRRNSLSQPSTARSRRSSVSMASTGGLNFPRGRSSSVDSKMEEDAFFAEKANW